jgi:hypothetical protein
MPTQEEWMAVTLSGKVLPHFAHMVSLVTMAGLT